MSMKERVGVFRMVVSDVLQSRKYLRQSRKLKDKRLAAHRLKLAKELASTAGFDFPEARTPSWLLGPVLTVEWKRGQQRALATPPPVRKVRIVKLGDLPAKQA
jgi:hypothetical protein